MKNVIILAMALVFGTAAQAQDTSRMSYAQFVQLMTEETYDGTFKGESYGFVEVCTVTLEKSAEGSEVVMTLASGSKFKLSVKPKAKIQMTQKYEADVYSKITLKWRDYTQYVVEITHLDQQYVNITLSNGNSRVECESSY